jgi:hypothetical protein
MGRGCLVRLGSRRNRDGEVAGSDGGEVGIGFLSGLRA